MRAIASRNSSVTPAVTAPSTQQASRSRRVNCRRRGRTRTTSISPPQASRRPATPSGPSWPNKGTDRASPSWTHDMDAAAISAPPWAPARPGARRRDAGGGAFMTPVKRRQLSTSTCRILINHPEILNNRSMETRRLELLAELSRLGSMRAVADTLSTTTSTVSQQIAVLGREMGTPLIEPTGRRVRLTPAGRRLAEHAVRILAAVETAQLDLGPQAEPNGTLRVAGFSTAFRAYLLPVITTLAATHPRVRVLLREHEPAEAMQLLAADQVDLALVYDYNLAPAAADPAMHTAPLWTARWGLGVPAGEPACAGATLAIFARFQGHDWIGNSRNTADEDVIRTLAAMAGFTPRITHQADSLDLVQDMITAGLGVGLLPLGHAAREGVRPVPLTAPDVELRAYAVTRDGRLNWPPLALVTGLLQHAQAKGTKQ